MMSRSGHVQMANKAQINQLTSQAKVVNATNQQTNNNMDNLKPKVNIIAKMNLKERLRLRLGLGLDWTEL